MIIRVFEHSVIWVLSLGTGHAPFCVFLMDEVGPWIRMSLLAPKIDLLYFAFKFDWFNFILNKS